MGNKSDENNMKTVNFIEAINSGNRFRVLNKCGMTSIWYEVKGGYLYRSKSKERIESTDVSFYNHNFELEEKSITITESEFDKVYADWVSALNMVNYHKESHKSGMKKDIGFR